MKKFYKGSWQNLYGYIITGKYEEKKQDFIKYLLS